MNFMRTLSKTVFHGMIQIGYHVYNMDIVKNNYILPYTENVGSGFDNLLQILKQHHIHHHITINGLVGKGDYNEFSRQNLSNNILTLFESNFSSINYPLNDFNINSGETRRNHREKINVKNVKVLAKKVSKMDLKREEDSNDISLHIQTVGIQKKYTVDKFCR